ncbi:OmpA family protein [Psychrobacter arenosus]
MRDRLLDTFKITGLLSFFLLSGCALQAVTAAPQALPANPLIEDVAAAQQLGSDDDPHRQQFTYDPGKSELKKTDLTAIAQIVKEYREIASYSKFKDKHWVFHIESHTAKDEVANELKLATARAEVIKQVLIEQYGIDPSLIQTHIHTSERPLVPNDSSAGRLINQRAYLTFSLDPI